jgi:hypothetical protein
LSAVAWASFHPRPQAVENTCFAEESGLLLQVASDAVDEVLGAYQAGGVTATSLGPVQGFGADAQVQLGGLSYFDLPHRLYRS